MIHGKKVIVVLPAYYAAKTLRQTFEAIPKEVVDEVLLVDDASQDETISIAQELGIVAFRHKVNLGYGANQKTCYREALKRGADVVIMVHPDYQYDPRLVPSMAHMIASDLYDAVIASRILGGTALAGGMPLYKYVANRFLTATQNLLIGAKLSEYHTGYRAFSKEILETLPLLNNSDDFVFDNEMLTQTLAYGFRVGEVSCPTKYFPEASSINFKRSVKYGLGVLITSLKCRLWKWGLYQPYIFKKSPTTQLMGSYYQDESRSLEMTIPNTDSPPTPQNSHLESNR